MSDEVEIFLAHYGVKGMKWGKRKSEESSSGSSGSAEPKATRAERKAERRETKAGKFDAKAAKFDTRVNDLQAALDSTPKNLLYYYKRSNLKQELKENTKIRDQHIKDANAVRNGKLTSTQKKVIIGSIAVAAVVGTVYGTQKAESGELNSAILRGKAFMKGEKFDFKKNPDFARKDLSPDDVLANVVKGVNPRYKEAGGSMNCRRASLVYEMRRRGMDVSATTTSLGWGQSESGLINALTPGEKNKSYATSLGAMTTGANTNIRSLAGKGKKLDTRVNPASVMKTVKDASSADNVLKALADQPDGARGEMVFNFGRFGHSMSWEIFNGKPVVFDTQKANKYEVTSEGWAKMAKKWGLQQEAEITRLDNLDLDINFLSRWATNSPGKKK